MVELSEWAQLLEDRTVRFSVDTVKLLSKYQNDPTLQPIINQIIRSATSIGANYA